jgi:membrane-associated phospholipid phosphatase
VGRLASEALLDSMIVGYGVKYMTARERPLENDGQGRFWKGGDSFPSGHAIHSWAVAMAIARDSSSPKWLKITSFGLATGVSLSRWGAQKHFPSDILVGGVFGGLIGNYVATRPR